MFVHYNKKGLKMDTSNSTMSVSLTDLILGKIKVDQAKLSQEDWLCLVNRVFEFVKPRLKYLSGFVSVEEHMNFTIPGIHSTQFVADQAIISATHLGKKKVVELVTLPKTPEMNAKYTAGMMTGAPVNYDYHLVITQSGEWFTWHTVYDLADGKGHRVCYKAKSIQVKKVSLTDLPLQIIETHVLRNRGRDHIHTLHLGLAIIYRFKSLLEETISERRGYLDEMSDCLRKIEKIQKHFEI
ncbi:MAG TPA: hypothetical protein VMR73_00645 [Candidatus Paceibacterota bacterium]|nr:hypothetical protein [Candidatus Paceibacterota bacterium]